MRCASETRCRHGEAVVDGRRIWRRHPDGDRALKTFNDRYAKETLDSRSVMIVMSDGHDTDSFSLQESEV
jgi:uncharacterized protein with von Willebrand factor type A (vWA) domain